MTATLSVVPYRPKADDHLRMATAISKRFVRRGRIADSDEYGDACLGLTRAAQDFIPETGQESWPSFAWTYMRNEIINGYRQRQEGLKYTRREILLEEIPDREHPEPIDVQAIVDQILVEVVGETNDDKFNRELMVLHYLQGQRVADLAELFGVTRSAIYQRIRRAVCQIQERQ